MLLAACELASEADCELVYWWNMKFLFNVDLVVLEVSTY
jgi:hypothetical protein